MRPCCSGVGPGPVLWAPAQNKQGSQRHASDEGGKDWGDTARISGGDWPPGAGGARDAEPCPHLPPQAASPPTAAASPAHRGGQSPPTAAAAGGRASNSPAPSEALPEPPPTRDLTGVGATAAASIFITHCALPPRSGAPGRRSAQLAKGAGARANGARRCGRGRDPSLGVSFGDCLEGPVSGPRDSHATKHSHTKRHENTAAVTPYVSPVAAFLRPCKSCVTATPQLRHSHSCVTATETV